MSNGHRVRGPRMQKDWSELVSAFVDLTADGTSLVNFIQPGVSATVIRMIGEYFLAPTPGGTFAAADEVEIVIGIGVVSEAARIAGGAALPNPHTDVGYPWLYRASHMFQSEDTSPSPSGFAQALLRQFDIRSMRKMKAKESLCTIVNYTDNAGTPPYTLGWGSTRVLFAGL